jgi:hypothetical protein
MIALLLLAAAQSPAANVEAAHAAYDRCVQQQTLELGAANQESADTILRAVRVRCNPQFMALVASFPGTTARSPEMVGWQNDSEGRAIAALLEARAKAPPSP